MKLFNPENIKGMGETSELKIKQMKNILNPIIKKPEKIRVKDEETRLETTKLFYSVALYFNLYFQKEKIKEMLENDKTCNFLIDELIRYRDFFKDLILSKNDVVKLIQKAEKYNQILNLLFYLGKDFLLFLEVLYECKDKILELFKKEYSDINNIDKQKKISFIEIGKYIEPKEEDNIEKINEMIDKIKMILSLDLENIYIKYSPNIIEKYIELYDKINLDNLILLKHIIESIKKIETNFKCKYKIEKIIHNNGIEFAKNKKLKNNNVLDFISKDEIFNNNISKKKDDNLLEIFDGIDINSLENDFFKNWKKINFPKIFNYDFTSFLNKISSLIKEMKDFGLLFSFFNFFQDKEIRPECVIVMQNKYKEIFNTYRIDECPNFIHDTVELIYLCDKNKINIKKFLKEEIQRLLDVKTVNNIYINLTEKYSFLSKDCSSIIIDYFTKSKENSNYSSLIFLIEKCKNLRGDIFSNINKYIIKNENEFFLIEETENYKFFKELVSKEILLKTQITKGDYISDTMAIISGLQEKIKTFNINYKSLIIFFPEDTKNKDIYEAKLLDRILNIFILDALEAKKYFENIKSKMREK